MYVKRLYIGYNSISAYKICSLHFEKLQFAPLAAFSGFIPDQVLDLNDGGVTSINIFTSRVMSHLKYIVAFYKFTFSE